MPTSCINHVNNYWNHNLNYNYIWYLLAFIIKLHVIPWLIAQMQRRLWIWNLTC